MVEKLYEIILNYDAVYKITHSAKLLHINFDTVDAYIFHSDARIFDILKSNISDTYSHKYTNIKINSDDDLPFRKNIKHA